MAHTTVTNLISAPFYCKNECCSDILYMCQFPECYTFICEKCIEKEDAYIYSKKNNEKRIICIDCLPYVAVNTESSKIRIHSDKQSKSKSLAVTNKIYYPALKTGLLTSKNEFNLLSSKISIFAIAAAAAAAAAISVI